MYWNTYDWEKKCVLTPLNRSHIPVSTHLFFFFLTRTQEIYQNAQLGCTTWTGCFVQSSGPNLILYVYQTGSA